MSFNVFYNELLLIIYQMIIHEFAISLSEHQLQFIEINV